MTRKLYYENAYINEFDAKVLSVNECTDGYDVVLDSTAFFPEEGGQQSDTGYINSARVFHVYEKDGEIHHLVKDRVSVGNVKCILDFDERFDKMQCHTAEHIICGIIHSKYGLENVGFHLGKDEITFDISGLLSREELDEVETLANLAVFRNLEVETFFPSSDELESLEYRSKMDITENLRIVKIADVDSCACCAPHVKRTGEIGLIKILDFEKHRGGLRIRMVAGKRALLDYRSKYENVKKISALLSEPQHTTAKALEKYISDSELLRQVLKSSRLELARARALGLPSTDKNAVYFFPDFSIDEIREFSNEMKGRVGGILVALCGNDGDFKYIISSSTVDLSEKVKEINLNLDGRGGGKSMMIQGTFSAGLDRIRRYFLK